MGPVCVRLPVIVTDTDPTVTRTGLRASRWLGHPRDPTGEPAQAASPTGLKVRWRTSGLETDLGQAVRLPQECGPCPHAALPPAPVVRPTRARHEGCVSRGSVCTLPLSGVHASCRVYEYRGRRSTRRSVPAVLCRYDLWHLPHSFMLQSRRFPTSLRRSVPSGHSVINLHFSLVLTHSFQFGTDSWR